MQAMDTKVNSISVYFRLLGMLLREECSEARLADLKANDIFGELPYMPVHIYVTDGQRKISEWLNSAPLKVLADRARNDYMRLFVGPAKLLAPPWGSSYLTHDRLLFQRETLEVRDFYAKYGLMLENKYREPDDHIGLELHFLAYLAQREEMTVIKKFIKDHMLTWAGRWRADVVAHAETGFYSGLADMTLGGLMDNSQ